MNKKQRKAKKQKSRETPSKILRHKWARKLWVSLGQQILVWDGCPVLFDNRRYTEVIFEMLMDDCRPEEEKK